MVEVFILGLVFSILVGFISALAKGVIRFIAFIILGILALRVLGPVSQDFMTNFPSWLDSVVNRIEQVGEGLQAELDERDGGGLGTGGSIQSQPGFNDQPAFQPPSTTIQNPALPPNTTVTAPPSADRSGISSTPPQEPVIQYPRPRQAPFPEQESRSPVTAWW